MCVRLVVPASTSFAPARTMMSGMRKAPPISISSPRETTASLPLAKVLRTSRTAAALLLTTVASSAPLSSHSRPRIRESRSPRRPLSRSNSSASACRIAIMAAATASSARMARPRLVCRTVPVRLNTARTLGRDSASSFSTARAAMSCAPALATCPARNALRSLSRLSRTTATTEGCPKRFIAALARSVLSTSSTEGRRANEATG